MTRNTLYLALQSRRNALIARARAQYGASRVHTLQIVDAFNRRMLQILIG